nr:protein FAR1-RELATED SEQUENCE 5-like [Ipomoea batatas]
MVTEIILWHAVVGVDDCDGVMMGDAEVGRVEMSLGLTKYWMPVCDDGSKPGTGQCFETLWQAVDFYRTCASLGGSDVRHSTTKKDRDGEVVLQYLVCSREGYKSVSSVQSNIQDGVGGDSNTMTKKRRRVSNRVGYDCDGVMMGDAEVGRVEMSLGLTKYWMPVCDDGSKPGTATEDGTKTLINQLWTEIHACVSLAQTDIVRVKQLTQAVRQQKEAFIKEGDTTTTGNYRNPVIQSFCGPVSPTAILVKPPNVARNKGSGKRLKGMREKAIMENKKQPRKCRGCDQYARHNSRSCPVLQGLQ